jgi:hypothetical protein
VVFPKTQRQFGKREELNCQFSGAQKQGDSNMLGMIAAILIVLWLFGFFAFHVTAGLFHIILIVGIVLLLLHFFSGGRAEA